VLEGRGENFLRQTDEENNSGSEPSPQDWQEIVARLNQELHNPSEKKRLIFRTTLKMVKKSFNK
jgi:hypothetical protein